MKTLNKFINQIKFINFTKQIVVSIYTHRYFVGFILELNKIVRNNFHLVVSFVVAV